jgi:NAD(P)-dependent dehydrogenase (short-subunit alcohol dehydrogenase family)
MTYQFQPGDPSVLQDKVVVLTGGALGVGASLVRLLHSAGAHIFFGDVLDEPGKALEQELSSNSKPHIKFLHCDVTSYQDNLALFDEALKTCGRIDHAVANAGLGEQGGMFEPTATLESIRNEPNKAMSVVDVNLKGELHFANIASVYLRQGEGGGDRSLTLVSSVAGFREDPGLNVYVAAKHGVLGLMRVLREYVVTLSPPLSGFVDG